MPITADAITADAIREALAAPADSSGYHRAIDVSQAKPAAVIVPILFEPEPHALLVLRGSHLKDHAGEVGFPGGKPEPSDADLWGTAIREMEEEVALPRDRAERLGTLRPVPVITGRYLIHPFVAAIARGNAPRIASPEIARLLRLPFAALFRGEIPIGAVRGEWRGTPVLAPHFDLDGTILYGASAYIFQELCIRLAAHFGVSLPSPRIEDRPPWGDRYPD